MMSPQAKAGGFTLIELAIVIAIIGILALTAIFNFQENIAAAERGKANAVLNQLNSGAAMHIASTLDEPTDFNEFVAATAGAGIEVVIADPQCTRSAATTYACAMNQITATYTLQTNGSVTMAIT
jgi:prepilin-type N-terminal cleavage/methylation domain-containing protein